jgi:single-stranded-DNA-specific exonuclease
VTDNLRRLLVELLGFAALGAIADIMPLVDENRVIARFGLAQLKHSRNPGLRALITAAGLDGDNIDSEHVGFALGPRLNACGRMDHARDAAELFTTATPEQAAAIAKNLCKLNDQRRATEQRIADHAAKMAEEAGMTGEDRRAIVLAHAEWHAGVIGIVCSRLIERFHRPTILLQLRGDHAHGSGRSIEGFGLHAALGRCASHLLTYGGHDMAAGLKLDAAALVAFTEAFTADANTRIRPDELVGNLKFDCDARLEELTPAVVGELNGLAPFGVGNPHPRILLPNLRLQSAPQVFGGTGKHISLFVKQDSRAMRCVAWNWAERRDHFAPGMELDAIVSPRISDYNGLVEPVIEDIRLPSAAPVTV